MAEPVLDGPGIVARIRQRPAAAVARHVGLDARQSGALPDALYEPVNCIGRERAATAGALCLE